jgi:hypothetical protein
VRRLAVVAIALVTACSSGKGQLAPVAPTHEWPTTLAAAQSADSIGQYRVADSILVAFQARYPFTDAAAESIYWRALFKLDPANYGATPKDALDLLDQYLRAPHHEARQAEVRILRRTTVLVGTIQQLAEQAASEVDSARTETDSVKLAKRGADTKGRTKDEEIARLREEVEKLTAQLDETNQELDRIKKRLAAPKP